MPKRSKAEVKLEARRDYALSRVQNQRMIFNNTVARCRAAGETPNPQVIVDFNAAIDECEDKIRTEKRIDGIDRLIYHAQLQGILRAYVCPMSEVHTESILLISQMEDWGIPSEILDPLRSLIPKGGAGGADEQAIARGALRAIMREHNVSNTYVNEYETDIKAKCWWVGRFTAFFLLLSFTMFDLRALCPAFLKLSILCAGAAGSCGSVLSRMPSTEVKSSIVAVSLVRRIVSRVGAGVIGSVAGSALFAWGVIPIGINKMTYADSLTACDPTSGETCSVTNSLVVLAVPIILGFSERFLTSLDRRLFGEERATEKAEGGWACQKFCVRGGFQFFGWVNRSPYNTAN